MIRAKPFESWINRYQDYMPLWARESEQFHKRRFKALTLAGVSFLIILLVSLVWLNSGVSDAIVSGGGKVSVSAGGNWRKPAGLQVVALVFYGRRANVQILERYLRKNLVENGGILDRVHFVSQVRHPEDADYLTKIIESNPSRYTYRDFGMMSTFGNYTGLWDHDIEPDTIYLKIGDDDILFIADNAIPDLVQYKLNHPEHLLVSANIINHPRLQKVHSWFMAGLPFAPEHVPLHTATHEWKVSALPSSSLHEVISMDDWPDPPDYKHRWLPMRESTIDDCPMRMGLNCSGRPQWECAAIAHMTLFAHLENRMLPGYHEWTLMVFLDNERIYDFGVWDFHGLAYDRWSINFFAAWGHEIIAARPVPEDDEQHFSANHPKYLRKRFRLPDVLVLIVDCVAVGSALVSHFSYYWQSQVEGLTDVLDRYKALVIDRLDGDLILYDH